MPVSEYTKNQLIPEESKVPVSGYLGVIITSSVGFSVLSDHKTTTYSK